jgi:hypothetical protein
MSAGERLHPEKHGVPNPVLVRFDDCKLFLNLLVDAKCFGYTTVAIDAQEPLAGIKNQPIDRVINEVSIKISEGR